MRLLLLPPLLLLAACPCEVDPANPFACDDPTATAGTTDDPHDTINDPPDPPDMCPERDSLWGPCGDGSEAPNGQTCSGWACVVAESYTAVCAQSCAHLQQGEVCGTQVPYCEDPSSSGQVLLGECVDSWCVERCDPALAGADCTYAPAQVCVEWSGVPICAWHDEQP